MLCNNRTAGSRFFVCSTLALSIKHNSLEHSLDESISVIQPLLLTSSESTNPRAILSLEQIFSSRHHTMGRRQKLVLTCFSPLSDPGNHGSDPSTSLQVAPFQSENNSIWIGYHDQPSRKYLGVFPSFDEIIDRCRRNAFAGGANTSFPRFKTKIRIERGVTRDSNRPGHFLKHVCCAGCQELDSNCERLTLEFLPVLTDDSKYSKVYLVAYRFLLRGEQMVTLLFHSGHGRYMFQKTDGTLSKKLAMDSRHRCLGPSQSTSPQDGEDDSETSSLTQFDCVEDEDTADVRNRRRY